MAAILAAPDAAQATADRLKMRIREDHTIEAMAKAVEGVYRAAIAH